MKNAFIFLLLLIGFKATSQTCQVSFTNPTYNAGTGKFRATLTIASTSGNNAWELGNMNLRFNYPVNTLSTPTIAVNHLAASGFSYGNPTTTGSNTSTGVMSYNITLPSGTAGKPIPSSGFDMLTIEWNVTSVAGLSSSTNKLEWRAGTGYANPRLALVTSTQTTGCPAGCGFNFPPTTLPASSALILSPLIQASNPLSVTISKTDQTSCAAPNGSATAVPANGTTPYTYLWSNGATTPTISNLSAGTYSVTVTDNAAATATASTSIAGPAAVSGTASSVTAPSCSGGLNGSVVITPAGGSAPYSIAPAQTGLAAGSYQFTITDSNGCTGTVSVNIPNPTPVTATVTSQSNVSCFGSPNGSVTISASGGTAPYSVAPAQTGLAAGSYTFTVTDSKGCTTTVSATITQPNQLTASVTAQSNASCFGSLNGSVTVTATGGTAPYSVAPAQTGLAAGAYTFTVTDSKGCTTTVSATITQPTQVSATISSKNDATCFGSLNGSVSISSSGGTAPYSIAPAQTGLGAGAYTFTITDSNGCTATVTAIISQPAALSASITGQTDANCGQPVGSVSIGVSGGTAPYAITPVQTGLAAGPYTFTVTDANGCTTTVNAVINSTTGLQVSATAQNTSCFGGSDGSVSVNVSGGTAPYNVVPSQTGLSAGTYTFTVTDATGCSAIASATVGQPSAISAAVIGQSNVTCFGGLNGSVTVAATGGTAPYSVAPAQTGLAAGSYTFTVTDANGCSTTVSATITQPTQVSATISSKNDATCFGSLNGSVSISTSGGTAPYSISPAQTGLGAGNYTFVITDANGCSTTVNATITQPSALSATLTGQTDANCGQPTGSVTIGVSGGTAPYFISPAQTGLAAGSYTFTVTDANGCTTTVNAIVFSAAGLQASATAQNTSCFGGSDGSVSVNVSGGTAPYSVAPAQTGLSAGSYTFTVTDAAGCSVTTSAIVGQPTALTADLAGQSNATCYGSLNGSVTITAAGGTAPYSISPSQTGLGAGNYTFTVTDANGCSTTISATITQPSAVAATITAQTNVTCFGGLNGSVSISTSGGNAPYSISPSQTGLSAGSYTFTVTDANGCNTVVSATITQPDAISASVASQTPVNCAGGSDGSVTMSVSGGTAPYVLTSAAGTVNGNTVSGLAAGQYTFTITDSNGCSTTSTVGVSSNQVVINADAGPDVTLNCQTTSATLTATGGVSYEWSNGATAASITVSPTMTTTYTVTVTGATGCTGTDNVTVTVDTGISANAGPDVTLNCLTTSATITATGTGTFLWSTGATTASITISPSATTTYTVTVTGGNGCIASDDVVVTVDNAAPNGSAGPDGVINCVISSATLTATGGASYLWNNGSATASISVTPSATTDYSVTITGSNGCTVSDVATVVVDKTPPNANAGPDVVVTSSNPTTTLVASGGVSYVWSNGVTTASNTVSPTQTTSYAVTVTGANGCKATDIVLVTVERKVNLSFGNPQIIGNKFRFTVRLSSTDPFGIGSSNFRFNYNQNALSGLTLVSDVFPSPDFGTTTLTGTSQTTGIASVNTAYTGPVNSGLVMITGAGVDVVTLEFTITNPLATSNLVWRTSTTPKTAIVDDDKISSITIDQVSNLNYPLSPVSISSLTTTNVTCFGGSNGTAQVTAVGGLQPYSYLWNNGATSASVSNLSAGVYSVTVTDAVPTTAVQSVIISQPSEIVASSNINNVTCFGALNGSVVFDVSGGVGPYSIAPAQTGLAAGNYTFTITDASNCTKTVPVTITQPSALTATVTSTTEASCFGALNGSVVITPSGGTAPYSIAPTQNGLGAGTYTFTVTDANNCVTTVGATIQQPAALTATFTTKNVTCKGGNDGAVTFTPTGGTAPYSVSPSTTGLVAGDYTFVITDSKGCTVTYSASVLDGYQATVDAGADVTVDCTNPSAVLSTSSIGSYMWSNGDTAASTSVSPTITTIYTLSFTDINGCKATDDVKVTVDNAAPNAGAGADVTVTCTNPSTVLTGTGGVSYIWNNGTLQGGTVSPTITTIYTVTVTGANGCTATASKKVTANKGAPTANAGADVTVNCTSPSTILSATGGVSYAWSNGATQGGSVSPAVTTTYSVTVTGSNGCTAVDDKLVVADKVTIANAGPDVTTNCTNPTATLTATGGATYVWSSGSLSASITVNPLTTTTYSVTATGTNGCKGTDDVVVTVDKATPNGSAGPNGLINCNFSSATLTASGGVSYLWSNGATTASITASPTVTTNYTVIVTGANTCTTSAIASMIVDKTPPTASAGPDLTFNAANPTVTLVASGGVAYLWSNGVTTASNTITPTQAATYIVTVTGANGCTGSASALVSFGRTVNLAFVKPQINGNKFRVTLRLSAPETFGIGSSNFRFNYNNAALSGLTVISDIFPSPAFGNTTLTGTSQSTGIASVNTAYTGAADANLVTITPAGVDVAVLEFNITNPALSSNLIWRNTTTPKTTIVDDDKLSNLVVDQLLNLNFPLTPFQITSLNKTNNLCAGALNGTAQVAVQYGLQPYSYLWSNGATTASITGLASGVYTISITDASPNTISQSVTITEPAPLAASPIQNNVTCNGGNDGSVNILVSGGVAPYDIAPSQTGLSAGNYTFTVTDANGCKISLTATITEPAALSATITPKNVTCFGGNNGSVNISVSGGVAPYSISPAQSGLTAGNYTFTVTDTNGCFTTVSTSISQPDQLGASVEATFDVTCFGGQNGSVVINTTGGTAPYSIAPAQTGLSAGSYTFTVTDANGCSTSVFAAISQPSQLAATVESSVNVTCFGGQNGSVVINTTGGTAPYSIEPAQTGLSAGSYTFTVTDAKGCTTTVSAVISQPAALAASVTSKVNATCYGSLNGSVSITATGGTMPYSIAPAQSGLGAGNYDFTVTDFNGCSTIVSASISQPLPLVADVTSIVNVTCFGSLNGSVSISATGGTAPYSIWPAQTGLGAGSYTFTITDANGCTTTTDATITQPDALSATFTQVNVNCVGESNGSVDFNVTGGTAPYSVSPAQSGLSAGNYTFTITDSKGCFITKTVTILDGFSNSVNAGSDVTVNCFNPSATLTATGGSGTFLWSTGETTASISVSPVVTTTYSVTISTSSGCTASDEVVVTADKTAPFANAGADVTTNCINPSATLTATGQGAYAWSNGENTASISVNPGTSTIYTLTVTAANGCQSTDDVEVTVDKASPLANAGPDVTINCTNPTAVLTATGGISYAWSTGANTAGITVAPAVNTTFVVTVTGANGCKSSDDVVVSVDKAAPTANAGLDVTIAYGGSANLTATGGVSYMWSNGTASATTTVSPVNRTIYSVTVTGANGCTAKDDVVVAVEKKYSLSFVNTSIVGNKFRFTIRMSTNTPFCIGSNNLRFNFNKAALNNLTIVSDAYPHPAFGALTTLGTSYTSGIASINAAYTGAASACMVPITAAGTDLVTCEFTILNPALSTQFVWRSTTNPAISVVADDKLTVCLPDVLTGLNAPLTPMTLTGTTKQDVFCYGSASGSASVSVSGGLLPYSYLWSNGATTQSISNVVAGTYGVTVNDAFGYSVNTSVTINTPAASVFATFTQTNVTCNGGNNGSVSITATGGTTPYTITPAQTGLTAGTYTFTVTDASGCTTSVTATITQPSAISASLTQTNVTCNGGDNGSVSITATGGVAPYSIAPAQTGLTAGSYTFTVTDASGCTATVTATITQPTAILASLTKIDVSCHGANNGSVDLTATGGVPPYTFAPTQTGLSAGSYTFTVTDAAGCTATVSTTITQPAVLTANLTQTNVSCNGGDNGSVVVTPVGGTAPYSILPSQSGLAAGSYTFTVTDANGCSTTVSATITQPSELTSSAVKTDVLCYEGTTGAVDLSVSGGVSPYSYNWNTGANTQDLNGIAGGLYSVTVTDANGCSTSNYVQVNTPAAPFTTDAGADVTINCSRPSTVLNAVGGDSFVWSNGAVQGGSVSPTVTTTYTVTATIFGQCTATDQVTVYADFVKPIADAGADQTLDCSPSYTLTATGDGTYLWNTGATTATITVDPISTTTYSVTVTASNGCTDSDSVSLIDNTAPVFATTFPADLTVNCHDVNTLPNLDDIVIDIVDDCNVYVSGNESSTRTITGCSSTSYLIRRTWTAYDASGNSSVKTQTITVIDEVAPTFTSFPPASGGNYSNETTPRPAVLTAIDNCSAVTIVLDSIVVKNPLTGCQSYNNTVTRRWTAYDACGNSTQVTQTFNTSGLILLTCPADKTLSTNSDGSNNYNCSTLILASNNLKPNFADLCDISNVLKFSVGGATILNGNGSINGNSLNRGVNNVTYTIASVSGNQSCSFKVTVVDTELPKFGTPTTVVLDACAFPASLPTSANPVPTDNCSTPTLSVLSDVTADLSSTCSGSPAASKYTRSLTRTWMATDASGNTATVVQKFFLRDMMAPTASCKTGVIINISSANISVPASTFNNVSSDNCTPSSALQFFACRGAGCTSFTSTVTFSPSLIPSGATQVVIPVSLRVVDACGNASVCTVNMTLRKSTSKLENTSNAGNNLAATQDNEKSNSAVSASVPSGVVAAHGEMKCFPNPFSDDLNIQYNLTNDESEVVMKVYDNQGKVVKVMEMSSQFKGYYSVRWNLSDLDSGMYHVCLELGGKCTKVERVVLLK